MIDLARLLLFYGSFEPPPSRTDVIRNLVELSVRYEVAQVIYETTIEIKGQPDPAASARAAIDQLAHRGLANERESRSATQLVGYLLDAAPAVRGAVADALAKWPRELRARVGA